MPDEAVLRIVLQGGGGTAGMPAPSAPTSSLAHSPPPPRPTVDASSPQQSTAPVDSLVGVPAHLDAIHKVFLQSLNDLDAAADALKVLGFAAKDIDAVRRGLEGPQLPTRDAAPAQQTAPRKPAANDQFDPQAEARKRREAERRKAQVDAAYKENYGGGEKESGMDQFLKVADSLRGVMGGVFGPLVGSLLDAVSSVHEAGTKSSRDKREEQLLEEARRTTASVDSLHKPAPPPKRTEVDTAPPPSSTPAKPPALPVPTSPGPPTTPAVPAPPPRTVPPHRAVLDALQADAEKGAAAAEGAGAGGGMAGMAGAAGPIGLIVAAAMEVDKAVKGAIKGAIDTAGNVATSIASPNSDPAEPIAKLGDAASSASDKLGPFSYGVMAAGESLKVLSSVMQAISQTADRYGEYSPAIAQSQAVAEIRQTMGDFRRAQEVGTEMAKYVLAQSDLQQRFEDIKVKLLTQMLPMITSVVTMIEAIVATGQGTAESIKMLTTPLTEIAGGVLEFLNMKKEENLPEIHDPTEQIINPRFSESPDVKGWLPDR